MKLYELVDQVILDGDWIIHHVNNNGESFLKYLDELTDNEVWKYSNMEIKRICPVISTYRTQTIFVELI